MSETKRVALITGSSGAIGTATLERFKQNDYLVAAVDLNVDDATSGGVDLAMALDVRDAPMVSECISAVLRKLGRIDVLVNVAGVTSTGSAVDISEEEWSRVLDINLTGTFRFCKAVIPSMIAQKSGRIINIGSILGKNGGNARPWINSHEQAGSGNVAYGVSKAGVHALTTYLAKELARDGVTVNAVAPGPIASRMTRSLPATLIEQIPIGRLGTPDEVAGAIAFLASDAAAFISGEIIDINGAMWCD